MRLWKGHLFRSFCCALLILSSPARATEVGFVTAEVTTEIRHEIANADHSDNWIIVANGPPIPIQQLTRAMQRHHVIALDGAANMMQRNNIFPEVILGDFDSIVDKDYWGIQHTFFDIDDSSTPYVGHFGILIVPAKDQDHTDLEKGILFCDAHGARSILIVNGTGGRMDHTLGNIGTLRKYYRKDRPLRIATDSEIIEYVNNSLITIEGDPGQQCAIMGYPEAFMTSTGLTYNGVDYHLKLGVQESTCNTLAERLATILIRGEAIVIHQGDVSDE